MTATELNPGLLMILAGLVTALLPLGARRFVTIAAPVLGIIVLLATPLGAQSVVTVAGLPLTILRLDGLAYPFALIFLIAALLNAIYALHQDDRLQDGAGMVYAGAAIGAALAGDLVTLFLYWELTAISSVFLILAAGTRSAYRASMRYLVWQIGSGVLLLAGLLAHYRATGSLAFGAMQLGSLGSWLIFIAFAIKCAFPLLHSWVQDAYPEATVTGTVMLSAFTTKLAVYAFARTFAGESLLVPIGAIMICFPVFFAIIENDLRRVLAYSLNSQLGFMVVAIGIGSELAINGAVGHAFAHIIYKGLLFMSMGAVLYRAGTVKASELGGLYRSMPWTTLFCVIGALSIAGFPLTSGFVTKTLTLGAAEYAGYFWVGLLILFASAGVFEQAGIKVPFFAFFSKDSGRRVEEAPTNMLVAMGIAAAACIFIGLFPSVLYGILPYPVEKSPYTVASVVIKLQILAFSLLAFSVLVRKGLWPSDLPSTHLNSDWFLRKPGAAVVQGVVRAAARVNEAIANTSEAAAVGLSRLMYAMNDPKGPFGKPWPTGRMAFWTTAMLGAYLFLWYIV